MSTHSISQMSVSQLQTAFLALQARIVRHAQIYFRDIRCSHRRSDCIAEVIGLCWKWFIRLARRGKDARQFPTVLANFAARAVRNGRRLCGQLKPKDVLSEAAQQKHSFRVESLPTATRRSYEALYGTGGGQRLLDCFEERLQDNTVTPVPDQAAFRCDFPAWLATWTQRDQSIIADMAQNERTTQLARKYRLSPGRISDLRREFHDDWQRFVADPVEQRGPGSVPA